jgi:hypothetical protein
MVNYYHTGIYVLVVDLKMSTYIAIKLKKFNFIFFSVAGNCTLCHPNDLAILGDGCQPDRHLWQHF